MPLAPELIVDAFAGLEGGAQDARIGADGKRVFVAGHAAGQDHKTARTVALWKRLGAPGRGAARLARLDPDLEDAGGFRLQIIFGMADAAARAHHLHVTGFGAAMIAHAVAMSDGALTDISDDFHVGMGMGRKSRVRLDLVVIPDPERAPAHAGRVIIIGEGKMMLGVEPAMVCATQAGE